MKYEWNNILDLESLQDSEYEYKVFFDPSRSFASVVLLLGKIAIFVPKSCINYEITTR